jgi:uncharacterized radical SAM superfamily Fe-S cluster-containing enzyme
VGRPCVGIIEINSTAEPGFVGANIVDEPRMDFSLTKEQLADMLDAFAAKAETLEMIYFTGADPAGHPELSDFIEMAYERGVARIGLQCDGLRIAHDDRLLAMLSRLKPVIFLEFDGFDETTSLILHGRRDLPYEAMRALDRLAAAGLPAALLTNVSKGANLQEIGAIAAYGFEHPAVFCTLFRPVPPQQNRLQVSDAGQLNAAGIIESLERQSQGLLDEVDFAPAFCCRPSRHFVAEMPVAREEQVTPAPTVEPTSQVAKTGTPSTNGALSPQSDSPRFWLGIHDFMTPWCYDPKKAHNCPIVVILPDGRTIPYCLFNALGAASCSP